MKIKESWNSGGFSSDGDFFDTHFKCVRFEDLGQMFKLNMQQRPYRYGPGNWPYKNYHLEVVSEKEVERIKSRKDIKWNDMYKFYHVPEKKKKKIG